MKKIICLLMVAASTISYGFGQVDEFQDLIDQGVKLYDKGAYREAIDVFKKALKIDKKSPLANYEIALTYFALKEYEKAIEHSDAVISAKSKYVDQACILKGSALDVMGQLKDAIKTYKKAIKDYPENHLLHYNLALTYFNMKELEDAEESLRKALSIKPMHPSSHLLLGHVMGAQGSRVKSLLALYNFLLLEPQSKRSKSALDLLKSELRKGVRQESSNSISISLPASEKSDDFMAAELMLAMLEASRGLEKNEGKTEYELFYSNTKSFFSMLGELKKKNNGFWWEYYVDFFYEMVNKEHVEAFSYYITQSREDDNIKSWLAGHPEKVESLLKWSESFNRSR